jgi:hypothetical protein
MAVLPFKCVEGSAIVLVWCVVVDWVLQVVRELQVPEDWPPSDDNDLALLVNETVQVGCLHDASSGHM